MHTTTSRVSTGSRIRDIVTYLDQFCGECKRLLEDYAEAIKAHIRVTGQRQLAAMQYRSDVLAELETLVLNASEQRAKARRAFNDHVGTHQIAGQEPKAAMA